MTITPYGMPMPQTFPAQQPQQPGTRFMSQASGSTLAPWATNRQLQSTYRDLYQAGAQQFSKSAMPNDPMRGQLRADFKQQYDPSNFGFGSQQAWNPQVQGLLSAYQQNPGRGAQHPNNAGLLSYLSNPFGQFR